ncbi:MAG: cyclic 2,3-diphosphoglycerate synthase [Pseudomonadota bacterium]
MSAKQHPVKVLIMGAAGRDFHNFNTVYREDPGARVVAFTAAQIPDIAGRRYPAELAGAYYPDGIPIVDEEDLDALCRRERVEQVVFAYSDVDYVNVMRKSAVVLAAGADFLLLGPEHTQLKAKVPVIAVSAVRTGCGKSQTTRWLCRLLSRHGIRVAVIRHPMPYGDLARQAVQRFATVEDLDAAECTVEEREEYEPHLALGNLVYAGVDYPVIVTLAEAEVDLILWEGGNNDFPFIRPDLHLVLVDPLRPGDESRYHPGEAVLRMADIVVVAKSDVASPMNVETVKESILPINREARVVLGASPLEMDDSAAVSGKRVLVVEDGPTITHGGMAYGAGYVAANKHGAAKIVDPRPSASAGILEVYMAYPHIGRVLPAVGYHPEQLKDLQDTINASDADIVVCATPCDLASLIHIEKPVVRVRYEFDEVGEPKLSELIEDFLKKRDLARSG